MEYFHTPAGSEQDAVYGRLVNAAGGWQENRLPGCGAGKEIPALFFSARKAAAELE